MFFNTYIFELAETVSALESVLHLPQVEAEAREMSARTFSTFLTDPRGGLHKRISDIVSSPDQNERMGGRGSTMERSGMGCSS